MDTGIIPPVGWYRSPKKGWFRWFKTKNRSEWVIVTPFGTFYQITNSPHSALIASLPRQERGK